MGCRIATAWSDLRSGEGGSDLCSEPCTKAALIFAGLYRWQNVWFARTVWAMHGLRLPSLVGGAFFAAPGTATPPAFYITAIVVVVINLWMLARAGWDL